MNEPWQEAFLTTTTRVGFQLKLTQPMLEFLCAISDGVYWDRAKYRCIFKPDNWISTEHALRSRGLIERKAPEIFDAEKKKDDDAIPYRLTPIGVAVVEMLKIGGLFIEAEKARERMAKRKGRN